MQKNPFFDTKKTAVIVVDLQNDFTEFGHGSLAISGTDENYIKYACQVTKQLKDKGYTIYASQDWHPSNHMSFASNHPQAKAFDLIDYQGRKQVMWPDHCIQNSLGAKILLPSESYDTIIQKGMRSDYDSYSAFFDDGKKKTLLEQKIKTLKVSHLVIYGLALDYCVKATVCDAVALGFSVLLLEDLCKSVDNKSVDKNLSEISSLGVTIENSQSFSHK